jgi:CubicO group peptidase (beta-lactamase class C family)
MMCPRSRRILPSVIAWLLIAASFLAAQEKALRIGELLKKYQEYGQFNGSVLVADHGTMIFKKGYGDANKEWNIPNTPDTKFRLGSITKQFTATLILQLVEQGKIRLDGKIVDYLPDYPKPMGEKITIHHLLTHTSGIPNYTNFPSFRGELSKVPSSPENFIKTFWNLPLEFEPGSKFNYSNSGYFLLGVIVEKVTGQSYARLLDERIFKPLGMANSGYDQGSPILPKRAAGYQKRGGTFVNAEHVDMSTPFSAGALYSTTDDLFLWDRALYTDKILSEKSKAAMFEPRIRTSLSPGSLDCYGYGWFIGKQQIGSSSDSVFAISHGGSINGFNSLLDRIPQSQSLIVLLNNTGGAPLGAIAQRILGILFDKPYAGAIRSLADVVRETIEKSGTEAAAARFRELSPKRSEYSLSEDEINNLGYEYLQAGKLREAIAVFRMNVEAFPKSFNVYDSLGEAYAAAGEKDLAITNYEKSIELNSKSESGIEALKKLRAK